MAILIIAIVILAYVNGANDNFKGVATLFGSATTSYRRALAWATLTTLAGSVLALVLAQRLVGTFQGKGLIPDAIANEPTFLLAVSLGAALALWLATVLGLPVSTTHALTGGLLGAGLLAAGSAVQFASLGTNFVLPLLVSPLLALLLTLLVYPLFRWGGRAWGLSRQGCLCVGTGEGEMQAQTNGCVQLVQTGVLVEVGTTLSDCEQRLPGRMLGVEIGLLLDGLHFLSAGLVSFARGLNDTPKIAALLLAGQALDPGVGVLLVAAAMALGGLLQARKVADTMSRRITHMNAGQGFTANLVTSSLVLTASGLGLPVSTTHVSVGALFGIGATTGTAQPRTIGRILLSWLATLPLAALLAAGVYWVM